MLALILGITLQALSRWATNRKSADEPAARLGRPEVMPEHVKEAIRKRYKDSYKVWGTHVLRDWAIREGLGEYAPETIGRAIKDLRDPPPEKKKSKRYEVTAPGVMWSEDGSGFKDNGRKRELLVLQDECARYKANHRLADGPAKALDVNEYLEEAFKRFGAPLVLKHDGDPIFLEKEVQKTLERHGVVDLTGPAYYPKYNGKKERSMRDIKTFERAMRRHGPKVTTLEYRIDAAIHDLNEVRPRPVLGGRTAREVFEHTPRVQVDRTRFRKEVDFKESQLKTAARSRKERMSARRRAIEEVLFLYGLLAERVDVSSNLRGRTRKN